MINIAEDISEEIQKFDKIESVDSMSLEAHFTKHGQIVGQIILHVGEFRQEVDFGSLIPYLVRMNLYMDGDITRSISMNNLN